MPDVTIGFQLVAHNGEYPLMREQWLRAEDMGVDALYTSDHCNAIPVNPDTIAQPQDGSFHRAVVAANVFEGASIEAAMAATTTRPKIGCIVHAAPYRNPNMMAFIAGTIDQISGGRFVLGLGTGYAKEDFDKFGFEYGTQTSRSHALDASLDDIKSRLTQLVPAPINPIPIMIASMGEKIGLRIVAKHADIWHVFGPYEVMKHKLDVLKRHCDDVGRDIAEIELATFYWPHVMRGEDDTLDNYLKLGVKHVISIAEGHQGWQTDDLADLLKWRQSL